MSDLNYKLSWGLVHLGYNVTGNYACSNQATHEDIKETWVNSDAVPTEENILKAYDEWVEADKKLQYQRDRASQYPSYANQFDTIYHQGIDAWKAEIKKVKDANPKPSE
tara:strand:+ start:365 stop:691 length:327 start_codon:yes stop_codon:yes gene_type:complete